MGAVDAILGQLHADGEELELRGVLNLAGFEVTPYNDASGQPQGWTITSPSGSATVSAAGIGTIAVPGVLRGIAGTSTFRSITVGGFSTAADTGGGQFYWDDASTAADDGGTCIWPNAIVLNPATPGRWKRILKDSIHADWFGARGDASRIEGNATGTDDTAAINAAIQVAAATGYRLTFSATKAYRIDGTLSFDGLTGVVLDGGGGPVRTNTQGAIFKFTGARKGNTPGVWMRSQKGCDPVSIRFDVTAVPATLAAADFSYANGAARLTASRTQADVGKTAADTAVDFSYANAATRVAVVAWGAGDVGKTAIDLDTGLLWLLTAQAAGVATWLAVQQRTANFTYANAAARATAAATGWVTADKGKYARDKDTGKLWILTATSNPIGTGSATWTEIPTLRFQYCGTDANAPTIWLPESLSIVECGYLDKYLSTQTATGSAFNKFRRCLFKDHDKTTYRVFDRALRLASTISSDVIECYFANTRTGVSGAGSSYGSGFSNKNNVTCCTFVNCDDYGVVNPSENWCIQDCVFEAHSDASADGVKFTIGGCHAVNLSGNWHGDHSSGTCLVLYGVQGIKISGCMFGTGCTRSATIDSCLGVEASGNYVYGAWEFLNGATTNQGAAIGPNHWGGGGLEVLGANNVLGLTVMSRNAFMSGTAFQGNAGAGSANFGESNGATGTNAASLGKLGTASGNQSTTLGFTCTASGNNSIAGGVCGRATRVAELALGGNDAGTTAVGAFGSHIMPLSLSTSVANTQTGILTDAVHATAITLENGRSYAFLVNFVATENTTTPTKRFAALRYVHASCQLVTGVSTATVESITVLATSDPQTTGNTVNVTASGATLQFKMTNNSGVPMLFGATVVWSEIFG